MRSNEPTDSVFSKYSSIREPDLSSCPPEKPVEKVNKVPGNTPIMAYEQRAKPKLPSDRRVRVFVGGMQYYLVPDEATDEAQIRAIGQRADAMIKEILETSPKMSMMSATTIALLQAIHESYGLQNRQKDQGSRMDEYESFFSAQKASFVHLREINWELKKEVLALRKRLEAVEGKKGAMSDKLPLEDLEKEKHKKET